MKISLSSVEYAWIVKKPIEVFLEVAKGMGVKYVELWTPHLEPTPKKALEEAGLSVSCVAAGTTFTMKDAKAQIAALKRCMEIAIDLDAKNVLTFCGPYNNIEVRLAKNAINNFINNISECVDYAQDHDLTIVMENEIWDDVTRTVDGCLRTLKDVDSKHFRLTYDPCNFYLVGEEPYPFAYEELKEYIGLIHIKDAKKAREGDLDEEHGTYEIVPVGEGAINYEGLFKALNRDVYNGFISLEPHVLGVTFEGLLAVTRSSLEYLRSKQGVC